MKKSTGTRGGRSNDPGCREWGGATGCVYTIPKKAILRSGFNFTTNGSRQILQNSNTTLTRDNG